MSALIGTAVRGNLNATLPTPAGCWRVPVAAPGQIPGKAGRPHAFRELEVQLAEQRFFQRYNEAPTGTRFKQKYCKPVYESDAQATEARDFVTALGRGVSPGSSSGGGSASSGVMAAGGASAGTTGGGGPNSAEAGVSSGGSNGAVSAGAQVASPAGVAAPIGGGGTIAAFVDIETERPAFQKNVVEVASKSPELIKLLQEHAAARERYEALYRQMNGPKPEKTEIPAAPAKP